MCYHISNDKPDYDAMEQRLQRRLSVPEAYQPYYHLTGFAHPQVEGAPMDDDCIVPMTWGIVEPDTVDIEEYWKKEGGRTLNTQSEHVFKNKRTATAIIERRCIVPVTGFFEPHHVGKKSFPFYVHEADKDYLGLLGCFQRFDEFLVFTILTGPANRFLAEIHNNKKRMPLICSPGLYESWLDPNLNEGQIKEIMSTDSEQPLKAYPVTKGVTNSHVESNTKEALEPAQYPELNTLF